MNRLLRAMRTFTPRLAGVACTWLAMPAHADEPFDVAWRAPPECPSQLEVERRLLELHAGRRRNAAIQVRGLVEQHAGRYRLRLETKLDDRAGERVVVGPTCEQVTEAGIAVLALLFDAEARGIEQPAPQAPLPVTLPPRVRAAQAVRKPELDGAELGPGYFVSSGLGVGAGTLPGLAVAFEIRAGARLPPWSFRVFAQLWPARAGHSSASETAGAELSLTTAGLLFCRELAGAPAVWRVCGGIEGERLAAQGFGVANPRSVVELGPALVGGTGFSVGVGSRLALEWNLEATVPRSRARFVLGQLGTAYERPSWGGRTTLGLELAF